MATTPIARVAAYAALAQQRGVDLIDALADAGDPPRRVELHVSDLEAVLAALADACDDTQRCARCNAVHCDTCGLGDGISDCDPPHCAGDSWCWCGECRDDEARERQAEQRADIDMFGAV